MSAELQNDTFVEIFNMAVVFMKPKEIQQFAGNYFRILETEDVDLEQLLENTDTGFEEDNEFHKYLAEYLKEPEESYEEEEDFE